MDENLVEIIKQADPPDIFQQVFSDIDVAISGLFMLRGAAERLQKVDEKHFGSTRRREEMMLRLTELSLRDDDDPHMSLIGREKREYEDLRILHDAWYADFMPLFQSWSEQRIALQEHIQRMKL